MAGNSKEEDKSYVLDDKTYNDSYEVYRRGLLEQQKVWIANILPILVRTFPTDDRAYKILGIGSGWGDIDVVLIIGLLAELRKHNITCKIHCSIVERNAEFVDKFKERVKRNATQLENVTFDWFLTTAEDFIQDHSTEKFDLIHFIHSLYYMNEEEVLQKFISNLLTPKGCILIAVQSEVSIYTTNYNRYNGKIDGAWGIFYIITDKMLKDIAEKNGWQHEALIGKRKIEISDMFNKRSPEGEKLIDFFFHSENLLDQLKDDVIEDILTFFKANSFSEGNRIFAVADEGIAVMFHS